MGRNGIAYAGLDMVWVIAQAGLNNTAKVIMSKEDKPKCGGTKNYETIRRDAALIKDFVKCVGYSELIIKYNISRQRMEQILQRWYIAAQYILSEQKNAVQQETS